MRIFTQTRSGINFQNLDKPTDPELNMPVVCLLLTHSYSTPEILLLQNLLSDQERKKASRFRFIEDQHSYIITHANLRKILGSYLGCEPLEIEFDFNEFGKPFLAEKHRKIHFNLSHRSGLSVLAFSSNSEIGADVEKIDPEFDFDPIARAHFPRAENFFIHAQQQKACQKFFTLWTRKEAFFKAVGTGIGKNLGIEVFRKVNHYQPEAPFPEAHNDDCYIDTFDFQAKYMISIAGSSQRNLIGIVQSENKQTG